LLDVSNSVKYFFITLCFFRIFKKVSSFSLGKSSLSDNIKLESSKLKSNTIIPSIKSAGRFRAQVLDVDTL
jgi:hypothetical protein